VPVHKICSITLSFGGVVISQPTTDELVKDSLAYLCVRLCIHSFSHLVDAKLQVFFCCSKKKLKVFFLSTWVCKISQFQFKDAGGFQALVSGKTTEMHRIYVNERIVMDLYAWTPLRAPQRKFYDSWPKKLC
jgi:hypothetical protein